MRRVKRVRTPRPAAVVLTAEQEAVEQAKHREILRVLSVLLLAMFVTMLSSTIVGNALPRIIAELEGNQTQYTWVVTSTLLASTAATPIFSKLGDLFDKKRLMLVGLVVFAAGSLLSGMAQSANMLIGFRVLQGIGLGATQAMTMLIIATIIAPRQRGRYNGYMGATMAVATVSGPLIGGVIVDVSWLGWRWCFFSAVPVVLFAIFALARRLHVPHVRRANARVDWLGSLIITAAVSTLLIWLSLADHQFAWVSWPSVGMVTGSIVLGVAFVLVENRVPEPIVPMWILRERTTALAIVASLGVGTVMFGSNVFLGQYFQIARGYSPTDAGLLTLPMMLGVFLGSTLAGRWVTILGRWKRFVVAGISMLMVGTAMLGMIDSTTSLLSLSVGMAIAGLGLGASMQNLVLAVQNTVPLAHLGAASGSVTFLRSLGGAMGVQILGAVLVHRLGSLTAERLAAAGIPVSTDMSADSIDIAALPPHVAEIVRGAYGDGMGTVFSVAAGLCVLALLAAAFMRGSTLRDSVDLEELVVEKLPRDVSAGSTASAAAGSTASACG